MDFAPQKSAALLGMGASNIALCSTLSQKGYRLFLHDRRPQSAFLQANEWEAQGHTLCFGKQYLQNLSQPLLFRCPGMRPDLPQLQAAVQNGAHLTSEAEYVLAGAPCPVYGVTGSDGKTTTSSLLAAFLGATKKTVHLGGNIGTPLCSALATMHPQDVAVMELSSFQLLGIEHSPTVAIITNLSPNHLDYHHTMEEYIQAKAQIFLHSECKVAILNYDNPICRAFAKQLPSTVECRFFGKEDATENKPLFGAYRQGKLWIAGVPYLDCADIALPGQHNVENVLAALCACYDQITPAIATAVVRSFTGAPHRLQLVRTVRGVRYYDSSIDSTPTRTIAALSALHADCGRIHLILGGYDKQISFAPLRSPVTKCAKAVYLYGATKQALFRTLQGTAVPLFYADTFSQAVLSAAQHAVAGDVVLLSPACASFDAFVNFEARGKAFCDIVSLL